ncbi:tyrosine--tRNA ligase [Pseudohongiella sp.]|uniref:tyrosine--tRNA ligase n=1 Tax=marine sediment metagenome TaxID=412755 RepID=A0A0F9W4A9_9ZZZZ|nr:tyrosine--tRNA ligase [Pseudohongiella sp.]HDZ10276.1 tyrosine--tRNA ligase [Pseudohongiella sp.]HEA64256.1 tyrosine--tRNA ligase [Pseudohongiella sp.]
MAEKTVDILADLEARGLVSQMTSEEEFRSHLLSGSRTIYSGFDPTADSLHIGSLVPLLALRRFQLAGHKPLALVGGATGLIGDPSFKAAERQLNSVEVIGGWVDSLKEQMSRFLDFDCGTTSAEVVNNLDWTRELNVLSFLRDVGKHFSVNAMIQKESVKQRIEREGSGISFTEFSYMILQSYDFAELYQRHACTIQIGGSDQWGNITGGIDLSRRMYQGQVYGLTLPLVTKADGQKFGKTETGTVWLDPAKTSPYAFFQFWLNTADADVYRFLHYFTFLSPAQIADIEAADAAATGKPSAQGILAREVTGLVHGEDGLRAAERISSALFSGELGDLTESDFEQLRQDGLPATDAAGDAVAIIEALVSTGLAASNRVAREFVAAGAVSANGAKVPDTDALLSKAGALYGKYIVLKRGKKLFHLLRFT